jgi:hypothetical protein
MNLTINLHQCQSEFRQTERKSLRVLRMRHVTLRQIVESLQCLLKGLVCNVVVVHKDISLENVRAMATPLAGADVERGVEVAVTWKHGEQRG